jgi:hypothetical protein
MSHAHESGGEAARPQALLGKPCSTCGGTTRYTSSPTCVACNRDRCRAYFDRNRDKIKARTRAYDATRNQGARRRLRRRPTQSIRACYKERPLGMVFTRADASGKGFTAYYVEPCKEGHMCGRDHNDGCVDCTRAYPSPKQKAAIERNAATRAERERDRSFAQAERERRTAEREQATLERERKAAERVAEHERARAERERATAERAAGPRYEPKRVASPRLTDEERQAIERARAEKRPAAERERKEERARAKAEREEERARAKAERTRAEGEASPSRRARGQEALLSFSADEAAAIEAAIAAGRVTKIKRPIDV